jgi:hypothetical protein
MYRLVFYPSPARGRRQWRRWRRSMLRFTVRDCLMLTSTIALALAIVMPAARSYFYAIHHRWQFSIVMAFGLVDAFILFLIIKATLLCFDRFRTIASRRRRLGAIGRGSRKAGTNDLQERSMPDVLERRSQ